MRHEPDTAPKRSATGAGTAVTGAAAAPAAVSGAAAVAAAMDCPVGAMVTYRMLARPRRRQRARCERKRPESVGGSVSLARACEHRESVTRATRTHRKSEDRAATNAPEGVVLTVRRLPTGGTLCEKNPKIFLRRQWPNASCTYFPGHPHLPARPSPCPDAAGVKFAPASFAGSCRRHGLRCKSKHPRMPGNSLDRLSLPADAVHGKNQLGQFQPCLQILNIPLSPG
jgi:hypothetical protein